MYLYAQLNNFEVFITAWFNHSLYIVVNERINLLSINRKCRQHTCTLTV